MDKKDVVEKVNQVFTDSFEISEDMLNPGSNIFNDLGLDSLDVVDLVVALQQKFNVKIRDDERVRDIRTMQDIYNYIQNLGKEGALPKVEKR